MPKIELTILKEDILNSNYYNFTDCAITRAFKRIPNCSLVDEGCNIIGKYNNMKVHIPLKQYIDLSDKVVAMYKTVGITHDASVEAIEPQDFTYTLEWED